MHEKFAFKLNPKILRNAIEKGIFFEINYSESIVNSNKRSTIFSNAMTLIKATKGKNLILSSGSSKSLFHRSPQDVVAL